MNTLQVRLPSGDWRYITSIINERNFTHSIYDTNAVEGNKENLFAAAKAVSYLKLNNMVALRVANNDK